MLEPNVGLLLQGLSGALRDTVLTEVREPAAQRQLRAALHLLGRLSRCWDLPQALVRTENEDIEAVVTSIKARMEQSGQFGGKEDADWRHAVLPQATEKAEGINDPAFGSDMIRNRDLRINLEMLEQELRRDRVRDVDGACQRDLHGLFKRMVDRESVLAGDVAPAPIAQTQ